jgi:hypothetical protein
MNIDEGDKPWIPDFILDALREKDEKYGVLDDPWINFRNNYINDLARDFADDDDDEDALWDPEVHWFDRMLQHALNTYNRHLHWGHGEAASPLNGVIRTLQNRRVSGITHSQRRSFYDASGYRQTPEDKMVELVYTNGTRLSNLSEDEIRRRYQRDYNAVNILQRAENIYNDWVRWWNE